MQCIASETELKSRGFGGWTSCPLIRRFLAPPPKCSWERYWMAVSLWMYLWKAENRNIVGHFGQKVVDQPKPVETWTFPCFHGPVGVPRSHFEKRCANQYTEGNPETQSHSQDALSQPDVQTTLWCLDAMQPRLLNVTSMSIHQQQYQY